MVIAVLLYHRCLCSDAQIYTCMCTYLLVFLMYQLFYIILPCHACQNFITEEKRDTEIELITERTASITPEQGLIVLLPPPKSVKLINAVTVSLGCFSVHTYKGITYAGCYEGVDRIDENNKVTRSFISIKGCHVLSISVHDDRIYTLSSDSTVRVHDLEGSSITSWTYKTNSMLINQLAIISNQIAIPDWLNKTLVFYSLNGEVVNTLPCPLLTDTIVRLSAAYDNSIIISQCDSSLVYKVDTSTGDIIWQCKELTAPCGVICYRDEFVVVADTTKPTQLCVVSLHTGWSLCKIHIFDVYAL